MPSSVYTHDVFLHWRQRVLHTKHHMFDYFAPLVFDMELDAVLSLYKGCFSTLTAVDPSIPSTNCWLLRWCLTWYEMLSAFFAHDGFLHSSANCLTTSLLFDMGVRCCPQFLQMMVFYTDSSGSYHSERQLFDYFAARKRTSVAASRRRVVFGYTTFFCPLQINERSLLMNLVLFRTLTLSCADLTLETAKRKENAWCGSQGSRLILATGLAVRLPNLDATM